jgi:hypothetical protein
MRTGRGLQACASSLDAAPPMSAMPLLRIIDRFPLRAAEPATRNERCRETYNSRGPRGSC